MPIKHWVDNDAGYEQWLSMHHEGFMANLNREPHHRYLKIHRAIHKLPDRSNLGSVNPRTGNNYSKVTADQLSELIEWCKANIPTLALGDVNYCKTCDPMSDSPVESTPTANFSEYLLRADKILSRGIVSRPVGILNPQKVDAGSQQYYRDPKVRAWVLQRANGNCELCDMAAPFLNDNEEPYLESHHLVLLANGGADTPNNSAALCPNCHRKLHFGKDRTVLSEQLTQLISTKETSHSSD